MENNYSVGLYINRRIYFQLFIYFSGGFRGEKGGKSQFLSFFDKKGLYIYRKMRREWEVPILWDLI